MTDVHEVYRLVSAIRPMLAGRDPAVISATLADLLAMLIAGHHPDLRRDVLKQHMTLVRDLIPQNEKQMFGDEGWPVNG